MNSILNHFGLIPDGTRRWAKENDRNLLDAYILAMDGISKFVSILFQNEIQAASVYLLSTDNLIRKPEQLQPVIDAEVYLLDSLLPPLANLFDVQIHHAGRIDLLPNSYKEKLHNICLQTKDLKKKRLYLLAAYNPIDEIQIALNNSIGSAIDINKLSVPEKLDLIVRSSGESRLSNFLPLQAGYAEIIIEQKHFNDITEEDVKKYLTEFQIRKRRFGK